MYYTSEYRGIYIINQYTITIMLNQAQQQIKTLLGDTFDNVKGLSESRRIYASVMTADKDFKEYYAALSAKWNIPLSDIQTLYKSVDIYDKYFIHQEVAA